MRPPCLILALACSCAHAAVPGVSLRATGLAAIEAAGHAADAGSPGEGLEIVAAASADPDPAVAAALAVVRERLVAQAMAQVERRWATATVDAYASAVTLAEQIARADPGKQLFAQALRRQLDDLLWARYLEVEKEGNASAGPRQRKFIGPAPRPPY